MPDATEAAGDARELAARLEDVPFQIKHVVIGQDRMVERVLVAVLARGHCLIEGVPGLTKTLTVPTLATAAVACDPAILSGEPFDARSPGYTMSKSGAVARLVL